MTNISSLRGKVSSFITGQFTLLCVMKASFSIGDSVLTIVKYHQDQET